MSNKVVLASKSPRRKELFQMICSSFLAFDSDINEDKSKQLSPRECVRDLSQRKAKKVQECYPTDLIVAADTIVVFENKIYGKPRDEKEAKEMLFSFSGKTHEVITAYTLLYRSHLLCHEVHSFVTFFPLSEELIKRYIKEKDPLDKAGAYGIQDSSHDYPLISSFSGSFDNIIGFPLAQIKSDLVDFCTTFDFDFPFIEQK